MKIFIDSAETNDIIRLYQTGLVDGVTTNPSLIRKCGRDPIEVYQELMSVGLQDISMEVVGDAYEMIEEGKALHQQFMDACTVKVPCSPEGLDACNELANNGIRVNVTLIFDPAQAILAAKAGASYVSPFVGRLDDNSVDGLRLISDIADIFDRHHVATEILSASIRDVKSVSQSFANGASIVTMPPSVFEKMYNHVLTDKGLNIFNEDYKKYSS